MKIGTCEIKNRIVMSPMLMGFGQFDGCATEQLMDYYEERAKGGTGLIITEICRINDKHGAAAFAQLGISHDYQIPSLREFCERIHRHGAKLFVQLHHPGRQNVGLAICARLHCSDKDFQVVSENSVQDRAENRAVYVKAQYCAFIGVGKQVRAELFCGRQSARFEQKRSETSHTSIC